MKTLNLVYSDKSDIKYRIDKFPDGQQNITVGKLLEQVCVLNDLPNFLERTINKTDVVKIATRLRNFQDLEVLICATKSLRNLGVKEIHLYIPYLLGARSDRQFVEGGTSYLVDVVAPIINSLEFESVTVMDVHSDVAAACIKNLKSVDNIELVTWALTNINKNN